MGWRHGTWQAEHPLPLGAEEHAGVGTTVRAGDAIASGSAVGSVTVVPGARRLRIGTDELRGMLRVAVGASVSRGAVLARTSDRASRAVTSPIDGRLVHVSADGDLYVAPLLDRWIVRSTLDGEVTRADAGAVVVDGEAWTLAGVAAYGPDAVGELAMGVDSPVDELSPGRIDVRLRDRILIGGSRVAAEAITRAHACGVAGVVAGAAPAGGLRVVYGDDVLASGGPSRDDRPTVLCLVGFGSAALPREIFVPLVSLTGSRASIHTASARLFVFAEVSAVDVAPETSVLALAPDYSAVRPFEERHEIAGPTRFESEEESDALMTEAGAVPVPNVLPFDVRR